MTDKKLRILLSNDDGIHAPGLKTLEKIARTLTDDIWIVAPDQQQSGAAHSLTLHQPLRVRKFSARRYSVDGTPTDCVLMAIKEIIRGRLPDLILSGVNAGENLADDVTYSGTVAAAMEGTLLGIPSIALSQCTIIDSPIKWQTSLEHAPGIIKKLWHAQWPKDVLMNINFPNVIASKVKGWAITTQGLRPLYKTVVRCVDPRGHPYYWIGPGADLAAGEEHSDLTATANHMISVTPLHLDLTHQATFKKLASQFNT